MFEAMKKHPVLALVGVLVVWQLYADVQRVRAQMGA